MDEHQLYGVGREQFIAQRNAWAKVLRADGRREEAARVASLRKPSVAASTVNHLVRAEPDRFAVLLAAGDSLRTAQDRMLSGDGTADELRNAVERERAAVDALVSVAAQHGMSGAVSDRVAGTLHAAALDENARGQVSLGQLVEALRHVGFGGESLAAGRAPSPHRRKRSNVDARREPGRGQEPDVTAPSRADADRADQRERAEQRRVTEERKRARRAEREARRRLAAAERVLANAEQRHATTRAAFQDAEDRLGIARAEAQAAAAILDEAQRALDSL